MKKIIIIIFVLFSATSFCQIKADYCYPTGAVGTDNTGGYNLTVNGTNSLIPGYQGNAILTPNATSYLSYSTGIITSTWTRSYFIIFKVITNPTSGSGILFMSSQVSALKGGPAIGYTYYNYSPYSGGTNSLSLRATLDYHGIYTGVVEQRVDLNDGKWHVAALTFDHGVGTLKLYCDYKYYGSYTRAGNGGSSGGDGFWLSQGSATVNYANVGKATLFTTVLTQTQVNQRMYLYKGFMQ